MVLWWVANVVLVVVVAPVVVLLLHRLRRPVIEIRRYADDALEHGVLAIAELDAIDALPETRERVGTLAAQLTRYGAAVDRLLR